jgi:hypothetical protein
MREVIEQSHGEIPLYAVPIHGFGFDGTHGKLSHCGEIPRREFS